MKIFCKFPTINISFFIIINKHCVFFQYLDFVAPSDSRFSNSCISAKYCLIITNHEFET